jgi:hypothetical protein
MNDPCDSDSEKGEAAREADDDSSRPSEELIRRAEESDRASKQSPPH